MDQLSKQQLILLALLVSFVTSLATGIVTVSLMDQAPRGVIQTINRVVERTIEQVSPQEAATGKAVINSAEQLGLVMKNVSASIVKIKDQSKDQIIGLGAIVTGRGVMLTDKALISANGAEAVLADGLNIPISVVQSQINGDIVFVAPRVKITPTPVFKAISLGDSTVLGQSVFSLSGTSTLILGHGLIIEISPSQNLSNSQPTLIRTSIRSLNTLPGSLLFDLEGRAIGLYAPSFSSQDSLVFFPLKGLRTVIPVLR